MQLVCADHVRAGEDLTQMLLQTCHWAEVLGHCNVSVGSGAGEACSVQVSFQWKLWGLIPVCSQDMHPAPGTEQHFWVPQFVCSVRQLVSQPQMMWVGVVQTKRQQNTEWGFSTVWVTFAHTAHSYWLAPLVLSSEISNYDNELWPLFQKEK